MALKQKPRLLVVSTTPGPSKALVDVVRRLAGIFDVIVLSSNHPRFGLGDIVYRHFGIEPVLVEDAEIGYTPLSISEDQAFALLVRFQPDAVLTGTVYDPSGKQRPLEDAICLAASLASLPNFQFVEGWEVWYPRTWATKIADEYLVVDSHAKTLMVAEGVSMEQIEVVGYPRSLFLPERINALERVRIRTRLGIEENERLVIYLGQVTPDNATTLGWVSAALLPTDRLLLQRHPRDHRPLDQLLRSCQPDTVIVSDMETDDALHAADACISHFSLSSFTAAYLGIPTILTLLPEDAIRIRGVLGLYPTTLLGGTVEVYDCASFVHAFTDLRKPSEDFLANIRRSIVTSTDAIIARLIKRISTTPHHGAIPTKGTIHGRQN